MQIFTKKKYEIFCNNAPSRVNIATLNPRFALSNCLLSV